jgi:hypothetical protein
VTCAAATCSGSTYTAPVVCSGSGSCPVATTKNCTPYLCTSTGCPTHCNVDGDCVAGDYCTGLLGSCVPAMTAGIACTANDQCASGHCTDGFCCGSSLCPSCQSCGVSGSEGICANATAGSTDETGTCKDQGAVSCGTDGLCNGAGGCQDYGTSTVCATGCSTVLLSVSEFTTSFCDGGGSCVAGLSTLCLSACDDTLGCQ